MILNTKFAEIPTLYTKQNLENDLAAGVGSVVAGVGSNYHLFVDTDNACITISHKDAKCNGVASIGSVKPAIGITAAGIAMGYNRSSDGQWVNSVAITAAGNAIFYGTVNAYGGSIVGSLAVGGELLIGSTGSIHTDGKASYSSTTNGIWIGYDGGQYKLNIGGASSSLKWDGSNLYLNGVLAHTVVNGASAGATALQPAAIAGMLTASSSYILGGTVSVATPGQGVKSGDIAWNSSGVVTSGSGVAITDRGIVGAWQGQTTFSINGTTGAAIFKGDITGATGAFSGTVSAENITGGTITAAISIRSSGYIFSNASNFYSDYNAAVWAEPSGAGVHGVVGVIGSAYTNVAGVLGHSSCPTSSAVFCENTAGGDALEVHGRFRIDNSNLVTNLNADYLDGYHHTSFVRPSGNVLAQTATINGRTAQWVEVFINNNTYYMLVS